jgi:hypothetical protein
MNMPPSGLKKRNFKTDASGYDFPMAQPNHRDGQRRDALFH